MKNRSNLYVVVRSELNITFDGVVQSVTDGHVVGVYRTIERADEMAGQYNQQVADGKLPQFFYFEVQVGTYYDE